MLINIYIHICTYTSELLYVADTLWELSHPGYNAENIKTNDFSKILGAAGFIFHLIQLELIPNNQTYSGDKELTQYFIRLGQL